MLAGLAGIALLALAALAVAGFSDVFGPYFSDGGEVIGPPSLNPSLTGTAKEKYDFTIAGIQTNQSVAIAFPVANLKAVLVTVSGNLTNPVVLKTNNSATPTDTITFPAGGAEMMWTARAPAAQKPLTGALTTTFWTHAGTETVTVKVRVLYDA